MPLRVSFAVTNAVAFTALVVVASAARVWLALPPAYVAKAAVVFGGIALVTGGLVGAHHPFRRYGAANQTTTLRAAIVALVAASIGEPARPDVALAAAGATAAATALDFLDGWLARHGGMASAFGARFDMEVDALLIMALSVLAWQFGKAGAWVLLSGLMRYGFVTAGAIWPWLRRPLPPSRRSRALCVVQIAGLDLAIVPAVAVPASAWIAGGALVALAGSFFVDVLWLWRRRGY